MFDWWVWVSVWLLLLLGGAALCGWLCWGLWRRLRLLSRDLLTASALLAAVEAEAQTPNVPGHAAPEPLAIFERPAQMARHRERVRAESRMARKVRRAANRPGWARSVD